MSTEFKLGDYVRVFGVPKKIRYVHKFDDGTIEYSDSTDYRNGCFEPSAIVKWVPNQGDWIIFSLYPDSFHVHKVREVIGDTVFTTTNTSLGLSMVYPFIGELPKLAEILKDNK